MWDQTKKTLLVRAAFVHDAVAERYVCLAGAVPKKSAKRSDRHGDIDRYLNLEACHACAM